MPSVYAPDVLAHRLEYMGCPSGELADSLEVFRHTPAMQVVCDWLPRGDDQRHRILVLSGNIACGKSWAAYVAAAMQPRGRARIVSADAFGSIGDFGEENLRELASLTGIPFLVIDDLGLETYNDRFRTKFDRVIDRRSHSNVRTIITTNSDAQTLAERYGSRIISRLQGRGQYVELPDVDYRRHPEKLEELNVTKFTIPYVPFMEES